MPGYALINISHHERQMNHNRQKPMAVVHPRSAKTSGNITTLTSVHLKVECIIHLIRLQTMSSTAFMARLNQLQKGEGRIGLTASHLRPHLLQMGDLHQNSLATTSSRRQTIQIH